MSAQAAPTETPRAPASVLEHASALHRRFPVLQLILLVVLFEWGTWTIADFATTQSIKSMLISAAFLGLAGAGQTLVVLIGGIDFSIPAVISGASIVISQLTGSEHWSFVPSLLLCLTLGVSAGIANGYIAHRFRVQPLIVTLATGSIITGAVLVWTGGQAAGTAPAFLTRLTSVTSSTLEMSIPPVVAIWVIVALVLGVALRRTVGGRHLYATGANPLAAELALVPTRRVWVVVYALSAAFAALLGVLLAGYAGSGDSTIGDPYLFQGLAAVIVGGTTFGARGDYWRTVLGALMLTLLTTVLIGNGYTAADQQIIFGLLILVMVSGYGRGARLRDRL